MNRLATLTAVLLALGAAGCLSPMHHAAERGDAAEIHRLASAGADPNVINESADRWTPLSSAIFADQPLAVQALLDVGADPEFRTANGNALQMARAWNRPDIVPIVEAAIARKRERAAAAYAAAYPSSAAAPARPAPSGAIGLMLAADRQGNLLVNGVVPGSPAAEAGFLAGDRIVAIADRSVQTLTLGQAVALARGEPGTSVTVTYSRNGGDPLLVTMLRRALTASAAPVPAPAVAPSLPALVSDVDRPAEKGSERPDDFALVVGIESYQSLPKADYGVRDAEAVRRHLAALGVPERNIVALEGPAATKSKLQSYLQEWLPRNVKPGSTLFVYYSGHGAPDPKAGDAYLVPWDGDPMFLKSTAYPLKQLYADLAKVRAKRVIVALDACFSGAGGRSVLAQGARPLVVHVDAGVPADRRLTVLAAASGEEITGSLNDQGHGLFTYYLLKGLSGAAKNASGAVTPRSLYEYLKPRVEDEARRQNREQTPTLTGTGGGDAF